MPESINLQHGSGGEKMTELLNNLIFKNLGNEILNKKHDGAFLELDTECNVNRCLIVRKSS